MTHLTTWPADDPGRVLRDTDRPDEIAAALAPIGVRFDQWTIVDLPSDAGQDAVLTAYREQVDKVIADEGFILVDVVALHPTEAPDWPATATAARAKFLAEHTHADAEVRFFAAGAGVFYLHIGDEVHAVLCEAGDLLSVPAGTTHWFDMGTSPSFTAVRFFHDADGWVGDFTGSDIASRFPDFDVLYAVAVAAR
ncbi:MULTISPECIES: 1,2-dihydroxy-3-keto-5-methylthiopentene dioxygenase [Protofrankia]|uniref:Acireductone dioxygenase n=1 Tax=Candidatus Protofrankia datiscae TaxID=2716812 RepID=F8B5D7_9ACTN|nr:MULTISPECIES: cupin [Protofrankia]AEH07989.1 Acireductone dioxygenase [Candidatus Protofrankia datiscae]